MKRFRLLVLASILALASIVPGPALATENCSGQVILWEGSNGGGTGASRVIKFAIQAQSLDGNYRFVDGTVMDNRISSYQFSSSTETNSNLEFWTGYYYNGSYTFVLKHDGLVHNMPSGFNNNVSTIRWWCP